uniref:Uncharacterized protein n=1 Tax=Oryzias latipes TaxID=8090 RepID=A0A3B3HUB6_ORYLA
CCTCGSRRALFPHSWQLYGRSPVWTRWWTFRFTAFRKLFPQRSQVNVLGVCSRFTGFWPVWMNWCVLSVAARVKPFPHSLQVKRFSPVCMRAWRRRFCSRLKRRPHTSQLCGFSPACPRSPESP